MADATPTPVILLVDANAQQQSLFQAWAEVIAIDSHTLTDPATAKKIHCHIGYWFSPDNPVNNLKAIKTLAESVIPANTPLVLATRACYLNHLGDTVRPLFDDYLLLPLDNHFLARHLKRSLTFIQNKYQLAQTKQALSQQQQYDTLTQLPNRQLFLTTLNHSLARAKRHSTNVAVLLLNLDRFKDINDSQGHRVGDQLLVQVSTRLNKNLRSEDFIAYLGADEFAVIIHSYPKPEFMAHIAQKIISLLSQPYMVEQQTLILTSSIGIATFPSDGQDSATLMRAADNALHHAKAQGRDNYQFFTHQLQTRAQSHLTLNQSLHHALEAQQFYLMYQPQIDTQQGVVIGYEALIRWQDDDGNTINPLTFIPLAEETGLIRPIGQWVAKTACQQQQIWQSNNTTRMSINVSMRQLEDANFVPFIKNLLNQYQITPEQLELELTESSLIAQLDKTQTTLTDLYDLGIQLAIDDFGTGYSSLSYLKALPIHSLKIDRCFIRDMLDDKHTQTIVEVIIALAHSLQLNVIAEGVETQAQLDALQQLGCFNVQGYLFSPPVLAQDVPRTAKQIEKLFTKP